MKLRDNIPNKITPDRIRESIVQIFPITVIPFVPSIGYLYSFLTNMGYSYESANIEDQSNGKTGSSISSQTFSFEHLFISDDLKMKVQIRPGSITFNCIEEYLGWTDYSRRINELMKVLYDNKIVTNVHRIGVRYISEFPDADLFSKLEFDYQCPPFSDTDNIRRFTIEKRHEESRIILNLLQEKAEESELPARIDLDVINEGLKLESYDAFFSKLEETHDLEKRFFFSTLTEDFVNSLNPEY